MEKNNSSLVKKEELLYLPPNYAAKEKGRQIVRENGVFKQFGRVVWSPFKENPFPFIGVALVLGALGRSFYYEMRGQRERAFAMLQYKSAFAVFTVLACGGGLLYRDYKASKLEEESEKQNSENSK